MNKKQLFLHIGTQKTGTTTIQSILSKTKKKLESEGIAYLGRFAIPARKLRVVTEQNTEVENQIQSALENELREFENSNCKTFVVSNEKFSGDKMIAYRNSGLIAASLKRIFEPYNFDVKIIVFVRRQDKFIESTYAQRIYSGASLTFYEFLDQFTESDFHWSDLLDSYAAAFGKENILAQAFDRKYLPDENSLIHNFGKIIGSESLSDFSGKVLKNQGYSRNTLEIARLTNKHLDKREMRSLRDILREADPKKRSYSFFSSNERKAFLKNYEESNSRVAKEYFGFSHGNLFSEPIFTDSEEQNEHGYKGLDAEKVAVILSKAMIVLKRDYTNKIKETEQQLSSRQFFKKIVNKIRRTLP
ncbi:MAG: hypothetical protein RI575_11495 [Balneolaceae bacterium]|nr:hypothetical protein [Balneolaceae bacterium]MDR9409717.1 hypothetical protein [Balneolaceae bacterium]